MFCMLRAVILSYAMETAVKSCITTLLYPSILMRISVPLPVETVCVKSEIRYSVQVRARYYFSSERC